MLYRKPSLGGITVSMELISKYRTQLMGMAILLVALFHSSINPVNDGIGFLCFLGDMGVDIFFLVSGFGMYYTFLKKPTLKQFYIKRICRIVPAWFCINLVVHLLENNISDINWITFLKGMTGFNFWLDGSLYYWYIPAALMFYFLTPFFMRMYEVDKKKAYGIMGGIWIILISVCLVIHTTKYFIFLFRFPVYFIGIWLSDLAYHKKKLSNRNLFFLALVMVSGVAAEFFLKSNLDKSYMHYEYKYLIYLVIAVPLCIIVCALLDKTNYYFPVLYFLGGITLEIYLLHEFMLRRLTKWIGYVPFDSIGILYNILIFLFVAGVSYVVHKVLGKIAYKTLMPRKRGTTMNRRKE